MAQFNGSSADDVFHGTLDDDTFVSGGGKDLLSGGRGNDTFVLNGNLATGSSIDGGRGRDIVVFSGERADYTFKIESFRDFTISGGGAVYALSSIEVFRFADGDYIFSADELTLLRRSDGFDGSFRLFASEGFVGEIGGTGTVIGTTESEHIIVSGTFDRITFDSSFNSGGDIIELVASPVVYAAIRSGSNAIVTDDISTIIVPVGVKATEIRFSYTQMNLQFGGHSSAGINLGNTGLSENPQTLPGSDALSPTDWAPNGSARIFLNNRAEVILGGNYSVIGDADTQRVDWRSGDLTLSSAFRAVFDRFESERDSRRA